MKLIVFAAILGVAAASCPNKCSGHGACNLFDKCACQPNWSGADCSARKCAYGLSWVATADIDNAPAGGSLGGRHAYTECSSKGICDASSGECQCFDGYEGKGCRRQVCPNDCSGHGRCVYNRGVSGDYIGADRGPFFSGVSQSGDNNHAAFTSQTWDVDKSRQCACDRGWEGYDCANRICPSGDDPLTDCDTRREKDDVQLVLLEIADPSKIANACGSEVDCNTGFLSPNNYFTLTFTDMFGGNYTTTPIQLNDNAGCTAATWSNAGESSWVPASGSGKCFAETAANTQAALEAMPNHAIPTVTVNGFNPTRDGTFLGVGGGSDTHADGAAGTYTHTGTVWAGTNAVSLAWGVLVTFSNAATSGKQNTLVCDVGAAGTDNMPASQPRFNHNGIDLTANDYSSAQQDMGIRCGVFHVGASANEWQPSRFDGFKPFPGGLEYMHSFPSVTPGTGSDGLAGAGARSAFDFFTETTVSSYVAADGAQTVTAPKTSNLYKEAATCANRGSCDGSSGVCECFDGHTGEACATQTTFF
jgi:hypothetical protein